MKNKPAKENNRVEKMNQALVGIEVISMVDRIVDLEARNEALTNKNKLLTAKETVNDEKSYIQK